MVRGPALIEAGFITPKPNNYSAHANKISTRYNDKFVFSGIWV